MRVVIVSLAFAKLGKTQTQEFCDARIAKSAKKSNIVLNTPCSLSRKLALLHQPNAIRLIWRPYPGSAAKDARLYEW